MTALDILVKAVKEADSGLPSMQSDNDSTYEQLSYNERNLYKGQTDNKPVVSRSEIGGYIHE